MKILGVITARGGSKGIPGKNIKEIAGKPLIAYTIEAARASGVFDRLILSTDDADIAKIAKQYGCDVPFMRPKELAEDNTPHLSVLQHAVKWLKENENYNPDYVMILQPTSPLRQPIHIKESVDLILSTGADSVVSVSEVPKHFNPHWQFNLTGGDRLDIFTGGLFKKIITRRQNLGSTYFKNGAVFLFKTKFLSDPEPSIYGDDIRGYIMNEKFNVNIDTPDDWIEAEKKIKNILN